MNNLFDDSFGKSVVVGNKPQKVRRALLKTMDEDEQHQHRQAAMAHNQGESRRVSAPHLDETDDDA